MKTSLVMLLFIVSITPGFSQELRFDVHGNYHHPVLKEKLIKSTTLGDIIPYYPSSWISRYISVELESRNEGISTSAYSTNDVLTQDQHTLLKNAEIGTEIVINVNYESKNSLTGQTESGKMNYSVTVIPDTEAEFADGDLSQYIRENAIEQISTGGSAELNPALVNFTVDENGEITDVQVSKSSGDPEVDQLLLQVINNMPKWKPAENSEGLKVSQEFVLSVSGSNDC